MAPPAKVKHPRENRLNPADWLTGLTILFLGLVINFSRLKTWAPLPDEINYAISAKNLLANRTLIGSDIMFFPPLFVYFSALLQLIGSEPLFSVRLISAAAGALIPPLFYLAGRRYFDYKTALLATLGPLSLFALHQYSRLGQVEILALLFAAAAILFLLRQQPVSAGVALGLGLWAKEVTLGIIASGLLFLLFFPRRWRQIGLLLAGLAAPAGLLCLLGLLTSNNLLYEITASRGYDINMLKLAPLASLFALGANLSFNLFPRLFTPGEFLLFIALAPLTVFLLFYLVLRGALKKRPLPLLTLCYLIVHLPFFFLFTRKFDYYLLPAAILLLWTGITELIANPPPRLLRIAGAVLITLLVLFNLYAGQFLYYNQGTHRSFLPAVAQIPPGSGVATSHPTLVNYIAQQMGNNLKTKPLFKPNGYELNQEVFADTSIKVVLLKKYYYEKLRRQYPRTWDSLTGYFPEQQEFIDSTWSPWLSYRTGPALWEQHRNRLAEFVKPVGVVVFWRK